MKGAYDMCGRYTVFDPDENSLLNKFLKDAGFIEPVSDIRPTDPAPIILKKGSSLSVGLGFFGFPPFGNISTPVINARSETASGKRYFAEALLCRRCMIPASGFFEWSRDGQKYLFTRRDNEGLYMAGAYNEYGGIRKFVIFTRSATDDISDIHKRMPVILRSENVRDYISDPYAYEDLFIASPPPLSRVLCV